MSGDLAGKEMDSPLLIQRPGNVSSKTSLTIKAQWIEAPSFWNMISGCSSATSKHSQHVQINNRVYWHLYEKKTDPRHSHEKDNTTHFFFLVCCAEFPWKSGGAPDSQIGSVYHLGHMEARFVREYYLFHKVRVASMRLKMSTANALSIDLS